MAGLGSGRDGIVRDFCGFGLSRISAGLGGQEFCGFGLGPTLGAGHPNHPLGVKTAFGGPLNRSKGPPTLQRPVKWLGGVQTRLSDRAGDGLRRECQLCGQTRKVLGSER